MTVKLALPCPFCGRSPHVRQACNDPTYWLVSCPMSGDGCPAWPEVQAVGHDAAIDEWNTREGVPASRHIEAAIELGRVKQELKRRNYPDSIPPHIQVRMILGGAR